MSDNTYFSCFTYISLKVSTRPKVPNPSLWACQKLGHTNKQSPICGMQAAHETIPAPNPHKNLSTKLVPGTQNLGGCCSCQCCCYVEQYVWKATQYLLIDWLTQQCGINWKFSRAWCKVFARMNWCTKYFVKNEKKATSWLNGSVSSTLKSISIYELTTRCCIGDVLQNNYLLVFPPISSCFTNLYGIKNVWKKILTWQGRNHNHCSRLLQI